MSKYKPDYFRGENEPKDYATVEDPGHGSDFEVGRGDMMTFSRQVSESINAWVDDHSRDLDSMLARIKAGWIFAGGNETTWGTVAKMGWAKSKYCKVMSKEANNRPPKKETPFNGMSFDGLK